MEYMEVVCVCLRASVVGGWGEVCVSVCVRGTVSVSVVGYMGGLGRSVCLCSGVWAGMQA